MATLVVFGEPSDGRITGQNATYATARETAADAAGDSSTASQGQAFFAGPVYACFEALFGFDTSPIGIDRTVSSAIFSLRCTGGEDHSDTDFTAEVRPSAYGASVGFEDWVAGSGLGALTLLATFETSVLSTASYNDFADVALAASVNMTGMTQLMVNSDRHRLGTTPVGLEYVNWATADAVGTTNDPKLTVTYENNRKAFVSGDRAKETTVTTGTGDITLAGAVSDFQAFSSIPGILSGDVVAYAIVGTTEWEVGIGGWHTGNLLSRDRVLASSNAGALVNFSAGTKDVFNTFPAQSGALAMASQVQAGFSIIPNSCGTLVIDEFEVDTLELSTNAVLEIS